MIYFIQEDDGQERYVKIGRIDDPEVDKYSTKRLIERITELQVGNPRKFKIRAIIKGGKREEDMLHDKFEGAAIRGEWFEPRKELTDLIDVIPSFDTDHLRTTLGDVLGDELLAFIASLPGIPGIPPWPAAPVDLNVVVVPRMPRGPCFYAPESKSTES